jgi:signal transduction histidine kinase
VVLDSRTAPGASASLWRALAVFRIAALAYALILIVHNERIYRHPVAAAVVGGAITVWTVVAIGLYGRPATGRLRRWPLLVADLVVMGASLLVSPTIIGLHSLPTTRTLPGIAVAGAVLAWAIAAGWRGGAVAAVLMGAADLSTRGSINQTTLNSVVLLFFAAIAVGYTSSLGAAAQQRLTRAANLESATRTRERLARDIHDSVLQVLALVAHRAEHLDGEAKELGRLAGEQEAALRALIGTTRMPERADGAVDLRLALHAFAAATVTVSSPATPVELPAHIRDEIVAAVGSALDNVAQHTGGARAWVLVEDDGEAITVTVRDDGPGIAPGRLDAAAAAGRLGVAQSIQGRMRDVGGTTVITSQPGDGTEVELRLPHPRRH